MLTKVEWERLIERNKRDYLDGDAEERAWLLDSWQRHQDRMLGTAAAWEQLRNASPKEIEDQRQKAANYTHLIEWAEQQCLPVQPELLI